MTKLSVFARLRYFTQRYRKKIFLIFFPVLVFCLCIVLAFVLSYLLPWKALNAFSTRQYSTRFYDRRGNLLYILPLEEGLHREWLDLESMPKLLVETFIEAEDKSFYHHHGVDFKAIFRAAGQNLQSKKRISGASTISMQVARLIVPRKKLKVSIFGKFLEMLRAIRLELKLSKEEILELYLNGIPFGFQNEGLVSASKFFFGKEVYELTQKDMEQLVLIPRNPSLYAPTRICQYSYPNETPHFIQAVIEEKIKTMQAEVKHKSKPKAKVAKPLFASDEILSIDTNLNSYAQSLVLQSIQEYDFARISNGAVFAMDNRTGEILVWLGNKDWYNESDGQVDGVLTKNQAGSTMKPFLYALALEKGFSPQSVLPDVPMDFGGEEVYVPQNFNNRFNGPQLFRVCLASSLNIPAVYLLWRLGVDAYVEKLLDLGFESLRDERANQGLSMALGSAEVSLFELVRGFSVFANEGFLIPASSFFEDGEAKQVYASDIANIIADMLSDKEARALGFAYSKIFDTPYPTIFKTGTSNQFQNILALGASPSFTVGAWLGNLSGETVVGETGSSIPAKIVRSILDRLEEERIEKGEGVLTFEKPLHYKKDKVCALSGMIPSQYCTSTIEEFLLRGSETSRKICSWHYYYPERGRVEVRYPDEFQRWFASPNLEGSLFSSTDLKILYPLDRSVFLLDRGGSEDIQAIKLEAAGGKEKEANLFVDGNFISTKERPFIWYLPLQEGEHVLELVCGNENTFIRIDVR